MNDWQEIYADDLSIEWIPHKLSAELENGEIEEMKTLIFPGTEYMIWWDDSVKYWVIIHSPTLMTWGLLPTVDACRCFIIQSMQMTIKHELGTKMFPIEDERLYMDSLARHLGMSTYTSKKDRINIIMPH